MADKLIITAALTGNITLPMMTPALPVTPEQIAEEAIRCAEAGAASVHIHARDPKDARPSTNVDFYREIAQRMKARTKAIFVPTTGGTASMTIAERIKVVPALKPEMATCNMGSINFSIHPVAERYKDSDQKFPWEKEFAASTKDFVFKNSFADIEYYYKTMMENSTKPEFELYDVGHLYNMAWFVRKGIIKAPIWMQFVTGILGGIGCDVDSILAMKNTADRLLGAQNYKFSTIGVGFPNEFNANVLSIVMGGNVRVGLEDNLFISKGVQAKGSWELVEKMVRIAKEMGKEIATPDEAREIIGLKGLDKVGY